jgi:hypothetical protein
MMTDLDITRKLMENDISSVEQAFTDMGLTFQVIKSKHKKTSLFVEGSKNNMKKWVIETKRGSKRKTLRVTSVDVNYDMDNGGDYFDLHRFEKPKRKEKLNGRKVHFKLSIGRKSSSLTASAD